MLSNEQISILGHLSEKYKLGLRLDGNKVFRNNQMLNPWQTEEIYDTWYPRARDEFVNNLYLKHLNESKVPVEPAKVIVPPEQ